MKSNLCMLMLALFMGGCSGDGQQGANESTDVIADSVIGIEAPLQPSLQVSAQPGSLDLSWQGNSLNTIANVYVHDTLSGQETLVAENLPPQHDTLTLPSHSPSRPWQYQQFHVELCGVDDCVSSDRMPVSWLAGATAHRIAPGVFMHGERFAESIASNHDGSVVFTSLPLQGAVQVHFHNNFQWVSNDAIQVVPAYSDSIIDITSSGNGDMLAILLAATTENERQASASIVERLGEAWLVTGTFALPTNTVVDNTATLTLSTNGDQLLLNTAQQVLLYQRMALDWTLSRRFLAPADSRIAAVGADEHFSRLQILLQENNELRLFVSRLTSKLTTGTDVDMQDWPDTISTLVTGVDADSEVLIQSHEDGTSVIVAGWDTATQTERSPVLWRYTIGQADTQSALSPIDVMDSLRAPPASDARASLRFSASHALDTVVLGWQSKAGDDARLTSYRYNESIMHWQRALALPDARPTLAKQGFAGQVLLAANGETLLVAAPAGNATSADNHVGELLVFH